jgi:phospholipid/cholesterol/gamma-HCH transport system substrate-binding protein
LCNKKTLSITVKYENMALRNEVKVGILGLCAAVGLFWGYNFLKGSNVFSNGIVINAVFDNVEGLQIAAPITINGYRVGAVTNIYLATGDLQGKVVAELSLDGGTNVPKDSNSVAMLIQPSLMSGKTVELKFKGNCTGNCLQSGDRIMGKTASMMDGIKPIIDPYVEKLDSVSNLWAALASDEKGEIQAMMRDVRGTVGNLREISNQVNNLMVSSSVNIAVTVGNLKAMTDDLKMSNKEITATLKNVNTISQQVKDGEIDKLLKESQETIAMLNKTIASLQTTISKTNATIDQVKELTDFKKDEGLVSMLLYDKAFAKDMKITIQDVQFLLRDIRLHPERYRTVLSGRKKKYKHTELKDDPAHK